MDDWSLSFYLDIPKTYMFGFVSTLEVYLWKNLISKERDPMLFEKYWEKFSEIRDSGVYPYSLFYYSDSASELCRALKEKSLKALGGQPPENELKIKGSLWSVFHGRVSEL